MASRFPQLTLDHDIEGKFPPTTVAGAHSPFHGAADLPYFMGLGVLCGVTCFGTTEIISMSTR